MKYFENNVLFLHVDTKTMMPAFGKIEAIYLQSNDSVIFAVDQYETIACIASFTLFDS